MPRNSVAYDDDFFAWTQEQARLLREGELAEIDAANLAEEVESMGRSDRREIRSRLMVLLAHLLKWCFQPERRSPSWLATIAEQRLQIDLLLADSPSFNPVVAAALEADAYARARGMAMRETGLAAEAFPASCPFTPEQILDDEFMPE
jgi:hypothetical protein